MVQCTNTKSTEIITQIFLKSRFSGFLSYFEKENQNNSKFA